MRHGIVGHPFGANLLQDARGRIWTHMAMYDPAADRLVELTVADGAGLGTGWFGAHAGTPDGRLLFGSSHGVLAVDAAAFQPSGKPPPLAVAGVRINGAPRLAGQLADGLALGPQDRSFNIELVGLDFVGAARTRYRFRLQGFESPWTVSNADMRSASYSNLDPGSYTLQAQVAAGDGPWSSLPLEVVVHVAPRWWQTAGARGAALLGALLVLSAAFWGALQLRTRALRARQAALEQRVGERTAALQALTAELEREKALLVESTFTDALTGLRNRRFLAQHIEADIALTLRQHAQSPQRPAAPPTDADLVFFLIDIDHFKAANDGHGHAAGDAVIQQMRDRLRLVFRDSDYLVRWGGEEFLVVARGTSRRHAAVLAERIRAAVADVPFVLAGGAPLRKTCSIGYCCFPLSVRQPQALDWTATVQLADAAMLAVKQGGRNGWLGLRDGGGLSEPLLRSLPNIAVTEWPAIGGLLVERPAAAA